MPCTASSVALAATHELLPALRLMFPVAVDAPREALDASAVFVARDAGDRVCAATMVQPMIGAVGLAWPPRAESPEVADALVAAACDWLRSRGVKVCQSFATNGERSTMLPLERNGFRRVTQLVSLRRDHLSTTAAKHALAFALESPPFTEAFRDATLATHKGTLDCPELERHAHGR